MTSFAKETLPISLEEEMRRSYLDYAMSVIVGRALPDARDGLKPVHRRVLFAMHELNNDWNRPYKKSARIVGDVIGKYHPHGDQSVYDTIVRMAQDFSHAPHAGRRPGQLRLGRRRQRRGDALHRDPPGQDRPRDARRSRQGDGRLRPELRRQREGAAGPAVEAAEPARQRLGRHRRRHGDQHPAAQPERGGRRLPAPAASPRGDDRRADGDHPGARLPDRRDHPRPGRRARGLSHRPRPGRDARQVPLRGHRQGPAPVDHRRRDPVPGEQEEPARADGRAGAREEARGHQPHPGRERQVGDARRHRAQARRGARGRAQQPLQADPAAGHLRHQHGGADRRPAEAVQPEGPDRDLPRAPARGGDAAHGVRAAQGARARPRARGPGRRAGQHRRVHRHDQGLADAAGRQERADDQELGLVDGARDAGPRRRRVGRRWRGAIGPQGLSPNFGLQADGLYRLSDEQASGDPADAPAAPDRPRAGQDPRRVPRGDGADRRPARHPGHAGAGDDDHRRRARRAEAGVRPDQARRSGAARSSTTRSTSAPRT